MGANPSSPLWCPCPFKTYTPQTLRAEIAKIQSQSASIMSGKNIRIVVCAIGKDGKSSTINNILSALEGEYSATASIGGEGRDEGGGDHVTQKYIEYHMLIGDLGAAKNTFYVLCDTPGLGEENEDLKTEAIKAAIEGKFSSGDTLDYENLTLEGLGKMQAKQPKAACVIFVIAATKVHLTHDKKSGTIAKSVPLKSLKSILDFARHHDIKTACLLTKCDELESDVKVDMKNIYFSESIETARLVIQEHFKGFPENRIFPIVNYTQILKTNPNMMVQTLFALKHILHDIYSNLRRTVGKADLC